MVIPLIFNFLLAMLFFPVATPQPIYSTIYGIYYSSLMSDLFYTYPFLYVFFYLTLDFVYCGLLACICLAVSRWIKQKWVVVILPLFICLTLTYGQRLFILPLCRFSINRPPIVFSPSGRNTVSCIMVLHPHISFSYFRYYLVDSPCMGAYVMEIY